ARAGGGRLSRQRLPRQRAIPRRGNSQGSRVNRCRRTVRAASVHEPCPTSRRSRSDSGGACGTTQVAVEKASGNAAKLDGLSRAVRRPAQIVVVTNRDIGFCASPAKRCPML